MRDDAVLEESWRPYGLNGAAVAEHGRETDTDVAVRELLARTGEIAKACASEAAALDEEGRFPAEAFARIGAAGLLSAPLPRALGGLGLGSEPGGTLPLLRALKMLGRGDLSVARIYEGHVNALFLTGLFGTTAQRERAAADARAGKLFAVWNTEGGDGVRFVPLPGGGYRLAGSKLFTSGALQIERALIGGRLPDGGWQLCLVPIDEVRVAADASVWKPLGMRASVSQKVDFTGVEVPDEALIGGPGDYNRQLWLSGGAIRFAAAQLGAAEALFDMLRSDLRSRDRTSDPFQRARAGEAAIAVRGGELWLRDAAAVLDGMPAAFRADPPPDAATAARVVAHANLMRMAIDAACLQVLELVDRSIGMRGLLRPHPVERIGRDLRLYLRQPAPDAALATAGAYVLETEGDAERLWTD
jgi:alkylation response protein AidB-like acyl-CoA dehydrogenase